MNSWHRAILVAAWLLCVLPLIISIQARSTQPIEFFPTDDITYANYIDFLEECVEGQGLIEGLARFTASEERSEYKERVSAKDTLAWGDIGYEDSYIYALYSLKRGASILGFSLSSRDTLYWANIVASFLLASLSALVVWVLSRSLVISLLAGSWVCLSPWLAKYLSFMDYAPVSAVLVMAFLALWLVESSWSGGHRALGIVMRAAAGVILGITLGTTPAASAILVAFILAEFTYGAIGLRLVKSPLRLARWVWHRGWPYVTGLALLLLVTQLPGMVYASHYHHINPLAHIWQHGTENIGASQDVPLTAARFLFFPLHLYWTDKATLLLVLACLTLGLAFYLRRWRGVRQTVTSLQDEASGGRSAAVLRFALFILMGWLVLEISPVTHIGRSFFWLYPPLVCGAWLLASWVVQHRFPLTVFLLLFLVQLSFWGNSLSDMRAARYSLMDTINREDPAQVFILNYDPNMRYLRKIDYLMATKPVALERLSDITGHYCAGTSALIIMGPNVPETILEGFDMPTWPRPSEEQISHLGGAVIDVPFYAQYPSFILEQRKGVALLATGSDITHWKEGVGAVQVALFPQGILDNPPTAPVVNVIPDSPQSNDHLLCTITAESTDPDGDAISYSYAWYKDGVLQPELTADTVHSSNTQWGEVWKCVVTPSDGVLDGPSGEDEVIIDKPPTAPVVNVIPDSPQSNDHLVCTITTQSTDPDGDATSYSYAWYKDEVLQPELTTDTVDSSNTQWGESWKCVVTPNDGLLDGPSGEDQVTLQNEPPTPPVVDIIPDSPQTSDHLLCTITTQSTDPDGDAISYSYAWYKDGVLQPELTADTVDSSNTQCGESWKCVVTPNDGFLDGPSGGDEAVIYWGIWTKFSAMEVLPEAESVRPWTTGGRFETEVASGGVLTIKTSGNATGFLIQPEERFDNAVGTTAEIKLKLVKGAKTDHDASLFSLQDGTFEGKVCFFSRRIEIYDQNTLQATCNVDTTSGFHTYRLCIVKGNFVVYVDGQMFASVTLVNQVPNKAIFFGDFSMGQEENISAQIDYVAYSVKGALAP